MDFRGGIVIAALWLAPVQLGPSSHACTSFTDISEPCGCTLSKETFDPICGSDGHTYLNECFLECRKAIDKAVISIDYIGVCNKESRCLCHAGYEPICGSNGVTYSNECLFNCFMKKNDEIHMKHAGECGSVVEKRLSDEIEHGTCRCRSRLRSYYTRFGDNRQRYARSPAPCDCRPKKQKLLSVKQVTTVQPTKKPVKCPYDDQNKKARPNEDMEANLAKLLSKKCVCAAMHKPVCGNNRQTYANFCVLYCSSKKEPCLKMRTWGDCL